jgi:hypothetical protein
MTFHEPDDLRPKMEDDEAMGTDARPFPIVDNINWSNAKVRQCTFPCLRSKEGAPLGDDRATFDSQTERRVDVIHARHKHDRSNGEPHNYCCCGQPTVMQSSALPIPSHTPHDYKG